MDQNKEIQKILKEIKHSKDEEKAIQASVALKKKQEDTIKELESLKMEVFAKEISNGTEKLEVGAFARMRNGTSSGEILSIDKNMAEIQMGFIKLKVPLIDLVAVKEPIEIRSKKSITTSITNNERLDTKIDIREYTKNDALQMLQNFLDRALINNAYELKIIHGVGTGVMKNEVKKMLRQYKDVKEFWHPDPDQGGDGVTLVRL